MARWWRVLLEAGMATLMLAHLRGLSIPGWRMDAVLVSRACNYGWWRQAQVCSRAEGKSGTQLGICPYPGRARKEEASQWGKATPQDKPFSPLATWSGSVTPSSSLEGDRVGLAVLAERAVPPA